MSAIAKTCAVLALAGSAAAFAPTMSLSANRRQVVQAGAAAAVAAPLLRTKPAEAIGGPATFDNFPGRAPVITVLDHRGCSRKGNEYTGTLAGNQDDEMCIVVRNPVISVSEETGRKYYQEIGSAFSCPTEGCK